MMLTLNDIKSELYRLAMLYEYNSDSDVPEDVLDYQPSDIDIIHKVDEYIYRLDMPEHGATTQVYGYYDLDNELCYALIGVQGESFTAIHTN